jgi:hypothetical protein
MLFYQIIADLEKDILQYFNLENLQKFNQKERGKKVFARNLYTYILYKYRFVNSFKEISIYTNISSTINNRKNYLKICKWKQENPIKFADMILEVPTWNYIEIIRIALNSNNRISRKRKKFKI